MKYLIFLLPLLFSTIFCLKSIPTFSTNSISVEYKNLPIEKKTKKEKYHKTKKQKGNYKVQQNNPDKIKGIVFLILGALFFILTIVFIASGIFNLGGWLAGGFILIFLGLVSFNVAVLFLILGGLFLKKGTTSPSTSTSTVIKKTDEELKAEVPNLNSREIEQYIEWSDELVALKIKRDNLQSDLRNRDKSREERESIDYEIKAIESKMKNIEENMEGLRRKSKNQS